MIDNFKTDPAEILVSGGGSSNNPFFKKPAPAN